MATDLRRQTWMAKNGDVPREWRVIDAEGVPLGRLAAEVATVLMGKHRPEYTPHVDTGDFVIVTNGTKVGLTGSKATQKLKLRYSGYPGGLKAETYGSVRERRPDRLIEDAVRRMLPKNRLGRVMLKKLRVYPGSEHPHTQHNPVPLEI
ncbi:MAG: 50S ribosomal protein L13 [Phycisphaerales bacterium]